MQFGGAVVADAEDDVAVGGETRCATGITGSARHDVSVESGRQAAVFHSLVAVQDKKFVVVNDRCVPTDGYDRVAGRCPCKWSCDAACVPQHPRSGGEISQRYGPGGTRPRQIGVAVHRRGESQFGAVGTVRGMRSVPIAVRQLPKRAGGQIELEQVRPNAAPDTGSVDLVVEALRHQEA